MPASARVPLPQSAGTIVKARPLAPAPEAHLRARSVGAQLLHCQKTVGNQAASKVVRAALAQSLAPRTPLPARGGAVAARSPVAPAGPQSEGARLPKPASDALHLQRAWYNIDIPFTDYQFDPSIAGVKTAATFVKDKAVAGFEWAVDEIKSLVFAGIDWLTGKWKAIQQFAASAFDAARKALGNIIGLIRNPMGFLANALMNLDAGALTKAWTSFSGMVSTVANGFKAVASGLLQQINSIWSGINGFASSLLNRLSGLTSNFMFRKLPEALQNVASSVIDRLRSVWKSISEGWTSLYNKIKAWVDSALDTVFTFVRRVASFGINVVIAGVIEFGKIALFLKDLFSDPQKYVGLLARRSVQAFEGVESRFQAVASQYLGSPTTAAPAAAARIQRTPAPDATAEPRGSATWSEMGHGIVEVMGKKWNEFKSNPLGIVTGLLMDMIFPVVGNVKDVIHLFTEIKSIVTGPLHAGSLQDVWTSLLRILDIPLLIYHTLVSILMRTLMLPLVVATFIPHPLVKGIAAAVGYALLGAFVQVELLNIGHKVLLLKTGATTGPQKAEAYNRIADSLIAMAMTAVIMVVMMILHFIANLMKAIYNLIKGKVFGIPPAPAEGKAALPGEGDKAPQDAGGAESAKAREGLPSKDGQRKIRINEEGKCEVCASPCDEIRRKYASVMTPEAEAKIKVVEGNAALSDAEKRLALQPVEQELADLLKLKAPVPGETRVIKLDSPARIQNTKPVETGKILNWRLIDGESGAEFSDVDVDISDPANPGPPDQYLTPKTAKLPTGEVVKLEADFRFTDESLKKNQSVWEEHFKKPLSDYSGSLADENLGNFQAEYSKIRAQDPAGTPAAWGNAAIAKISFGSGRARIGFGKFSVTMEGFQDVVIEMGPNKGQLVRDVPTAVKVSAKKTGANINPNP